MDFELTPEHKAFEAQIYAEVRELLKHPLIAPLEERIHAEPQVYRQVIKMLGDKGWLSLAWSKELGGQERTTIEEYIFYNAALGYHHIPYPFYEIAARSLDKYGNDEQRKKYIPAMLSGDLVLCGGFTEPEAGSDLASAKTRAVRNGDDWVINGQKIFTTFAEMADVVWLLAVTNPDAPAHQKFSMFVIPMDTPGISVQQIMTYGHHTTNYTFYDNVRVPNECLIGEEGQGWYHLMTVFSFERLGLSPHGRIERYLDDVGQWARETTYNGQRVIDNPWVRGKFVDIFIEKEAIKNLNYWAAWMMENGQLPVAQASAQKAFGTEARQRAMGGFLEMVGLQGQMEENSKLAPLKGRLMWDLKCSVVYSIGGGVNEVQRDIVALMGLGMPKSR